MRASASAPSSASLGAALRAQRAHACTLVRVVSAALRCKCRQAWRRRCAALLRQCAVRHAPEAAARLRPRRRAAPGAGRLVSCTPATVSLPAGCRLPLLAVRWRPARRAAAAGRAAPRDVHHARRRTRRANATPARAFCNPPKISSRQKQRQPGELAAHASLARPSVRGVSWRARYRPAVRRCCADAASACAYCESSTSASARRALKLAAPTTADQRRACAWRSAARLSALQAHNRRASCRTCAPSARTQRAPQRQAAQADRASRLQFS
jgi:hypothetical protein